MNLRPALRALTLATLTTAAASAGTFDALFDHARSLVTYEEAGAHVLEALERDETLLRVRGRWALTRHLVELGKAFPGSEEAERGVATRVLALLAERAPGMGTHGLAYFARKVPPQRLVDLLEVQTKDLCVIAREYTEEGDPYPVFRLAPALKALRAQGAGDADLLALAWILTNAARSGDACNMRLYLDQTFLREVEAGLGLGLMPAYLERAARGLELTDGRGEYEVFDDASLAPYPAAVAEAYAPEEASRIIATLAGRVLVRGEADGLAASERVFPDTTLEAIQQSIPAALQPSVFQRLRSRLPATLAARDLADMITRCRMAGGTPEQLQALRDVLTNPGQS